MSERKVVVRGGGDNLFKVSEYKSWFYVSQVDPGVFSDSHNNIGKTNSLKDAIELIRAYSGKDIDKICDW
jgi:hypothetical protein